METFLIFYLLGYFVSVIIGAGISCAAFLGEYGNADYREHLGFSLFWCMLMMVLWPITLFGLFCITGFAQRGWRVTPSGDSK